MIAETSYAATLVGEPSTLQRLAPCFRGDYARLLQIPVRDEYEWVLQSTEFDPCLAPDDVWEPAGKLVNAMCDLASIFAGSRWVLEVGSILTLDADGKPVKRRIARSMEVGVYARQGLDALASPFEDASTGTAVLALASARADIRQALELVRSTPLNWYQIYDVIKFLGDGEAIAKASLGDANVVKMTRQTANFHRHLGEDPLPLPANPPTLAAARNYVSGLLQEWIRRQLVKPI